MDSDVDYSRHCVLTTLTFRIVARMPSLFEPQVFLDQSRNWCLWPSDCICCESTCNILVHFISGCTLKAFTTTLIVLATVFYVACNIDGRVTSNWAEAHSDSWRRTAQGWEEMTEWQEDEPVISPEWTQVGSIHPALVGSLQLLISLGALLAWSSHRTAAAR